MLMDVLIGAGIFVLIAGVGAVGLKAYFVGMKADADRKKAESKRA